MIKSGYVYVRQIFSEKEKIMKKTGRFLQTMLLASVIMAFPVFADTEAEKAVEYLDEYYGITAFSDDEATLETVNDALVRLGGEELETDELTGEAIIAAGIRLAGLEELALTYTSEAAPEKAADVLEEMGMEEEISEKYLPYVACAMDQGLYDPYDDEVNEIETFLYHCIETAGKGRHYIGRIQDSDILSALRNELDSILLIDDEELTRVGTAIVLDGATTGYNLKSMGYDAHFLADYTLRYSHSDYVHAVQLVGLLMSEGYDGYLQIEPKVSAYEYMAEWGDPGAPTPTYKVEQVEDNRYICFAAEYDLVIEFESLEEKESFHDLIETYAKKYDDRVDENGDVTAALLAESWWQPLYYSITEANEDFGILTDNVICNADGTFAIHSFSTAGQEQAVADVVSKAAPDLSVIPVTIYVNPAFERYITGEDYQ